MGWVQLLLLAIRFGPAIVGLVAEIIELIKRMRADRAKRRTAGALNDVKIAEARLRGAIDHYRTRGDRSALRQLRADLQRDLGFAPRSGG